MARLPARSFGTLRREYGLMWGPEPVRLCTEDGIVLAADYYAGVSDGPSYLLGHGFTGSCQDAEVRAVAEHLHSAAVACWPLSFRGHGPREGLSTIGVDEVADVAAGLAWLRGAAAGCAGGHTRVLDGRLGRDPARRPGVQPASHPDAVVAVSGPGRWYERGTEPMRRLHLGVETRLGRLVLHRVFQTRIGGGWDLLPVSPVEVARRDQRADADRARRRRPVLRLAHPRMLAARDRRRPSCGSSRAWGTPRTPPTPELLDRIDDWARRSACLGRSPVTEDDGDGTPETAP